MKIKELISDFWKEALGLAAIGGGAYLLWGERALGWVLFIGGILLAFG